MQWKELQPLLSAAVGLAPDAQLSVWHYCGKDKEEEQWNPKVERLFWRGIMDVSDEDVLVVAALNAASPSPPVRRSDDVPPIRLSLESENHKRLAELYISGKKEVCVAFQQVRAPCSCLSRSVPAHRYEDNIPCGGRDPIRLETHLTLRLAGAA